MCVRETDKDLWDFWAANLTWIRDKENMKREIPHMT